MALVEIIGCLIRELAESPDLATDPQQLQRQLNGLYDLLLERTLDLSSYVRTKVLSVLAKLCDLPTKFPKQRLEITRAAIDSLEDKATSVRKTAVTLLVKLILTHPYVMDGGLLGLKDWEAHYQEVAQELAKVQGNVGKAVERDEDDEDEEGDEDDEEAQEGEAEEGSSDAEGGSRQRYVVLRM